MKICSLTYFRLNYFLIFVLRIKINFIFYILKLLSQFKKKDLILIFIKFDMMVFKFIKRFHIITSKYNSISSVRIIKLHSDINLTE